MEDLVWQATNLVGVTLLGFSVCGLWGGGCEGGSGVMMYHLSGHNRP